MRKPLATLSLVMATGLGVLTTADALAASPPSSPTNSPKVSSAPPSPPASPALHPNNAVSGAAIVQTALKYLGYMYTATGNSPATGFSCIGFASYVYRQNGIPLPGDLQDALNYAPQVPFSQIEPGDLLYFKDTVWTGLSHVAIYLGGGRFIHAEWYTYNPHGVRISSFNNDPRDGNYWIAHYMTANRPWGGAAMTPVVGSTVTNPTAPTTTSNKVVGGKQAVVTAPGGLNVRTGPSKSAGVVKVVPQGTSVTIISKSHGWDQVQLPDGTEGWVKASFVSTGGSVAAPATSTTSNPNIGTPTAPVASGQPAPAKVQTHHATTTSKVSGLRVHSSPSINAPVVTSIAAGQRVTVLSHRGGWTKIRTAAGQVGWVMSSYTSGSSRTTTSTTTYSSYSSQASNKASATRSAAKTTSRTTKRTTFTGGSRVTAGVRLHAGPSLSSRVIGGVAGGARVKVLGRSGAWVLVRTSTGQVGYVYGAYVR